MIVAMSRVKNEARWIKRCLRSLFPLCSAAFVMDDHSTDNTRKIAASIPKVEVLPSPFSGLDEARDKNWLYDRIMERCKPDWILCVDGDEELERSSNRTIRKAIKGESAAYRLKIKFLWNDKKTVRIDRVYGHFYRPSLFKPFYPRDDVPDDLKIAEEFRWMSTPFGRLNGKDRPNLHCSSVPQRRIHGAPNIEASLLHYGYMLREDRVRKLNWYTSIDWKNDAEDWYRHMVQGDGVTLEELPAALDLMRRGEMTAADAQRLTNIPASAALVHAGPVQLASL